MAAAAPTKTVTRDFDGRHIGDATPVWDKVLTTLWDADDTADATHAITIEGTLKKVIFETPDVTNTITFQVLIRDNADRTIFDSGEKAENATYSYDVDEVLSGTTDVVVGISAASGRAITAPVVTLKGI